MSELSDKLANLLAVTPVIILTTLANTFIAFVMAGFTFLELVSLAGWSKGFSLGAAILVAVAVHVYIACQPKIRNYIKARSQ